MILKDNNNYTYILYLLPKLPSLPKCLGLEFLTFISIFLPIIRKIHAIMLKKNLSSLFSVDLVQGLCRISYVHFRCCTRNSHAYRSLIPNSPCAIRMNRALRINGRER